LKGKDWISQNRLHLLLGFLGLALPLVVVIWGWILSGSIQNSLSDYYSLRTRNAFEGIMLAIGCVLVSYRGYDPLEYFASHLAGVCAVVVAFFPNTGVLGPYHFISATGLFLVLSFFPLCLWTKTDREPQDFRHKLTSLFNLGSAFNSRDMTRKKRIRNIIYVTCGFTILAGIILAGVSDIFWQHTPFFSLKPVLLFEWMMIWAISIAALVKGGALPFLKDMTNSEVLSS
jgi:hypothetical protein